MVSAWSPNIRNVGSRNAPPISHFVPGKARAQSIPITPPPSYSEQRAACWNDVGRDNVYADSQSSTNLMKFYAGAPPCPQATGCLHSTTAPRHLSTQEDRMGMPVSRQSRTMHIYQGQCGEGGQALPCCTWCGHPTGLVCDLCTIRPARPVCSDCCGEMNAGMLPDGDICRVCHEQQLQLIHNLQLRSSSHCPEEQTHSLSRTAKRRKIFPNSTSNGVHVFD